MNKPTVNIPTQGLDRPEQENRRAGKRTLAGILTLLLLAGCASLDTRGRLVSREWIEMYAPDGRKIRAFVARPQGDGSFPVVLVLHGTDGFRRRYLELAEEFARRGFVAVAGCWFEGRYYWPLGRAPQPDAPPQPDTIEDTDAIECPHGPRYEWGSLGATGDVMAIIEAAQKLRGVRSGRVGLFGHSFGALIALLTASMERGSEGMVKGEGGVAFLVPGGNVQAVVASAAFYSGLREPANARPVDLARHLAAPVLLLHGANDAVVDVREAREYELTLRELGKPVERHIYTGAPHDVPFDALTRDDVMQRAVTFFQKHLLSWRDIARRCYEDVIQHRTVVYRERAALLGRAACDQYVQDMEAREALEVLQEARMPPLGVGQVEPGLLPPTSR